MGKKAYSQEGFAKKKVYRTRPGRTEGIRNREKKKNEKKTYIKTLIGRGAET